MSRDIAMQWAGRGWRPIPINPDDKRPILKEWPSRASSDAAAVNTYWIDDAGIGLAMGVDPRTGQRTIVVDVDCKDWTANGYDTLQAAGVDPDTIDTLQTLTPSGGRHLFFVTDKPVRTMSAVAPGIDTRGDGGQVVAPGSIVGNGEYKLHRARPIARLPAALEALLSPAMLERDTPLDVGTRSAFRSGEGTEDLPGAENRARRYLAGCPDVAEHSRNDTMFKRLAKIRDFGVTRDTALTLISEHVAAKFEGDIEDKEIKTTVRSAYDNAQSPWGRDALRPVDTSATPTAAPIDSEGAAPVDPRFWWYDGTEATAAAIPPRPWLVEGLLMREIVSLLVAPGATGKSTWVMQVMIALALADVLPHETKVAMVGERYAAAFKVPEVCLYINNEDSRDELARRVEAICRGFGIDREALHGRFVLSSGASTEWRVAMRGETRQIIEGPDVAALRGFIRQHNVAVIACDPFISFHDASENNNDEMQKVTSIFKSLAAELKISVLLVHHTTKPNVASSESYAGNINSARGASAVKDAARAGFTMYGAGKADGDAFGIPEERRHRYVRLDDAKNNNTLDTGKPTWFQKETICLPNGDEVGVLKFAKLDRVEKPEKQKTSKSGAADTKN